MGMAVSGLVWSGAVVAEDYTFGRAWQEIQQISDVLAAERASVALGILLGLLLPGSEWAPPVVMVSSLPEPVLWISHWFPSTHAIQGFLNLNQMGAEFSQVLNHWWY